MGIKHATLAAVLLAIVVFLLWDYGREVPFPATDDHPQTAIAGGESGSEPSSRVVVLERTQIKKSESYPRLFGQIFSESGDPIEGASVYACLSSSIPLGDLRTWECVSNHEGEYELALPTEPSARIVDIGVTANGWLRELKRDYDISKNSGPLDITLTRGLSVGGVVLDQYGGPVSGVKIMVSQRFAHNTNKITFMTLGMLNTEDDICAIRDSEFYESRTVTDENGVFTAPGLPAGAFAVASCSIDRWFWQPKQVFAGESRVHIVANRPNSVRFLVSDAGSGEQVSCPRGRLRISGTASDGRRIKYNISGNGVLGEIVLAWIDSGPALRDLQVSAAVSAPGYERQEFQFSQSPSQLSEHSISLNKRQVHSVGFTASSGGLTLLEPLRILYRKPSAKKAGKAKFLSIVSEPQTDGTQVVMLPSGRWELRIARATDVSSEFYWPGEVYVRSEGLNLLQGVTLPYCGRLRVVAPRSLHGKQWNVELRGKGYFGILPCKEDANHIDITGLEDGTWYVAITGVVGHHEIRVTSLGEYEVRF